MCESDYLGVAAVATAAWPDNPTTAADLRLADEDRKPELLFDRVVAETEGRIVGSGSYGEPEGSLRPGKFAIAVFVHPEVGRRGVGNAIYHQIVQTLSQAGLAVLTASTSDTQTSAVAFLLKRGFEVVLRRRVMRLDVTSSAIRRMLTGKAVDAGQKVEITTLEDLMSSVSDWRRKCWELNWELVQDLPQPDTPTRPTLERFSRRYRHAAFPPASWFIALQGDEWVGMSRVYANPATPEVFYTGLTGVRRSLRRRGIATALKLRGIRYVLTQGGKFMETNNEENNPMLKLNLGLGFRPGATLLDFQKIF
jgi:GNAT superfamily N-acetyltransferase